MVIEADIHWWWRPQAFGWVGDLHRAPLEHVEIEHGGDEIPVPHAVLIHSDRIPMLLGDATRYLAIGQLGRATSNEATWGSMPNRNPPSAIGPVSHAHTFELSV